MKWEKLLTFVFALIAISSVLFMGGRFVANALEGKWAVNSKINPTVSERYREMIESETNASKLATDGTTLLKGNQLEAALVNLQKATEIDPNHRDAWVWLGYAQLKNDQPAEALKSLEKAEKIDPLNAQTFELLAIAYESTGNIDAAKNARKKFEELNK